MTGWGCSLGPNQERTEKRLGLGYLCVSLSFLPLKSLLNLSGLDTERCPSVVKDRPDRQRFKSREGPDLCRGHEDWGFQG